MTTLTLSDATIERIILALQVMATERTEPDAERAAYVAALNEVGEAVRGTDTTDTAAVCGKFVSWWDGEYEGNCELPADHEGDHFDGLSWFNDDNESRDWAHTDD